MITSRIPYIRLPSICIQGQLHSLRLHIRSAPTIYLEYRYRDLAISGGKTFLSILEDIGKLAQKWGFGEEAFKDLIMVRT